MNSLEKAVELYLKYQNLCKDFTKGVSQKEFAKECALSAVDEILSNRIMSNSSDWNMVKSYWEEVKKEIIKL